MHYKYKFEVNGKEVDWRNKQISQLITTMLLNLYEKNKNNKDVLLKR